MKKIFAIAVIAIGFYLSSCKKQELPEVQKPETTLKSNVEGELIDWNDLPDEYKNLDFKKPDWGEPVDPVSERANNSQDQVFKSFANTTGTAFNIPRQPDAVVIDRVYIGHGGSTVTYLTIWYRRPDGTRYAYSVGGSGGQLVQRVFADGEYIRSISGTSAGTLTSLTIRTNKSSIGAGTVNGIAFSYEATVGSYIGSISGGYSSSSVRQINAISYFKPWVQVAGANANDIALDTDGTAYMTSTDNRLYKMTSSSTMWTFVAGAPAYVLRVAAKAGKIAVVTPEGGVYQMLNNVWASLPGHPAKDVAVDAQGSVYKTGAIKGEVSVFNQPTRNWTLLADINAKRITAGTKSARVIDASGKMYGVAPGSITTMPGYDGRDISIAEDNLVWMTNTAGKMYVLQGLHGATWKEITGSDGNNIAAASGIAMLVNTVGKAYRMVY